MVVGSRLTLQQVGAPFEGDGYFLGMPQRDGWARVYLSFPLEQRDRFAGPAAAREFLQASRLSCLPRSERWAAGVAASQCSTDGGVA